MGALPPILEPLVTGPARGAQQVVAAVDLRAVDDDEIEMAVTDLIADQVASALGHASAAQVDVELGFQDLGLDSLAGVQLRNRLSALFALDMPSTVIFDCPTPSHLARWVVERLPRSPTPQAEPQAVQSPTNGLSDRIAAADEHELLRLIDREVLDS